MLPLPCPPDLDDLELLLFPPDLDGLELPPPLPELVFGADTTGADDCDGPVRTIGAYEGAGRTWTFGAGNLRGATGTPGVITTPGAILTPGGGIVPGRTPGGSGGAAIKRLEVKIRVPARDARESVFISGLSLGFLSIPVQNG